MAQWNKYERTAARQHGRPGREIRPKSTTIDMHAHVAIPKAAAFVKPHLDLTTIPLGHFASAETKALSQKQEDDMMFVYQDRVILLLDARTALSMAGYTFDSRQTPEGPQFVLRAPEEL